MALFKKSFSSFHTRIIIIRLCYNITGQLTCDVRTCVKNICKKCFSSTTWENGIKDIYGFQGIKATTEEKAFVLHQQQKLLWYKMFFCRIASITIKENVWSLWLPLLSGLRNNIAFLTRLHQTQCTLNVLIAASVAAYCNSGWKNVASDELTNESEIS